MSQYLDSTKLSELDTKTAIVLQSSDSYHEGKIFEKIKKLEAVDQARYLAIGMHIAIIGVGGQNYGEVKVAEELVDIKKYMQKQGIKYDSNLDTKLEDDDITPRRLSRLFRYQVRNHLMANPQQQSYLHKKYVDVKDQSEQTRINIFQGAEHLYDPKRDLDLARILIQAHRKMDRDLSERKQKPISITDRIIRVLNARGFSIKELE
mgnify:CR=1 FL=1